MSVGGWYEGTGRPCHEVLLKGGVWLLEELFFPDELLAYKTCALTAVPLKLKGFGGSPTRAYATV
jgi:kynurenine formamidase